MNLDLAKGFTARGFAVDFVLRNAHGELLEEAETIGHIVDLKSPRVRSVVAPLKAYFAKRRPDAVLASLWPLTVVTVWALSRSGYRCPVVLAEHGMLSRQYEKRGRLHGFALRHSLRYAAKRADGIVGVSQGVADDLAKLSGSDRGLFDVIYNPVAGPRTPTKQALAEVERMWNGGHGKRILSVGRFKAVKNHALLIEALSLLGDPDARLMLVGDGDLRGALQEQARSLGVSDQVIFAGFQTDLDAYYASADVFALSSWSEGFGNVIVEAMNHGLNIVSTDCPTGPREILEKGSYGWLTQPGNAEEMATALAGALASPRDPDRLKARAADFRPEVAIDSYLALLFHKKAT